MTRQQALFLVLGLILGALLGIGWQLAELIDAVERVEGR